MAFLDFLESPDLKEKTAALECPAFRDLKETAATLAPLDAMACPESLERREIADSTDCQERRENPDRLLVMDRRETPVFLASLVFVDRLDLPACLESPDRRENVVCPELDNLECLERRVCLEFLANKDAPETPEHLDKMDYLDSLVSREILLVFSHFLNKTQF